MPARLFSTPDRQDPRRAGEVRFERKDGGWGEILVPENRRVPGGRLISLQFRRQGPPGAPPLMVFGGGPGVSNFKQGVPGDVAARYTVVWVGYRGIDSSERLECKELKRALKAPRLGSPAALGEMAGSFAACVGGWRRDGIDIQGYQIRDVVEDGEDLRRALGLGRTHLFAVSYGTRVALAYMTLHPETMGRAVLLGANPPGHFFWSAEDVHRAFDAYQSFFDRTHPEYVGRVTLEALFAEVDARLARGEGGGRIDPERVRTVSFVLLFHQSTSSWAFDAYLRAYRSGDFAGLELMSVLYDHVVPRAFQWGDFLYQGLVNDWEAGRDYAHEAAAVPGRYGSPLGKILFGPPYPETLFAFRDPPLTLDVRTSTLALGGALDFSTPAHVGRALADHFPQAIRHVTAPDLGHAGDFFRDAALGPVMVGFYECEAVPSGDTFSARDVRFHRGVGLGHLRSTAIVTLALLAILGLAFLV